MDLYYVYRWNQLQLTKDVEDLSSLRERVEKAESAMGQKKKEV